MTVCAGRTALATASRARYTRLRAIHCSSSGAGGDISYKRKAAKLVVDTLVRDNCVLGLGTGELVNLAISEVGEKLASGSLKGVKGVCACDAAAQEAAFHGVPLVVADADIQVDLCIDEADQMDLSCNSFIKGVKSQPQQPMLLRSKTVREAARRLVVLVESGNVVPRLCGSLPVAIGADGWEETAEALDDIFLGDAEIWRRPTVAPAPPRGGDYPYISPEGHNILDIRFYEGLKLFGKDDAYRKIAREIDAVPGVAAHGLVLGLADSVVVASPAAEPQLLDMAAASSKQ